MSPAIAVTLMLSWVLIVKELEALRASLGLPELEQRLNLAEQANGVTTWTTVVLCDVGVLHIVTVEWR